MATASDACGQSRVTSNAARVARRAARPGFVMALTALTAAATLTDRQVGAALNAQSPSFGVGRPATPEEIRAIDIDVTPDGRGLPAGRGTAVTGKAVYAARCVTCHGATGKEGPQDILVGGQGTLTTPKPLKTVGSYWPYATTVWDYIHRAMPFDHPGTLTANDVYAVTAYMLFLNGIVAESEELDEHTLPNVKMPNRDGFVRDPRPDTGPRKK